MTRIMNAGDRTLTACELVVKDVEAVRQIWRDGWKYTGFLKSPRPKSGLVLICSDIRGTFELANGEVVTVGKGDVLYAPRGSRYQVTFKGGREKSRMDSYTIHFHLLNEGGEEILLADRPTVLANDPSCHFSVAAEALWRAVHRADIPQNLFKIKTAFYTLLDEVIDQVRGRDRDFYPIRAGVDALCNEWDRNERMSRYAELCGVCESYFYLLFKNCFGMSPVEYRNRIRMTNAGSLLVNSDLSVGEIAGLVGFEDPFYFSRVFRRTFGLSPLQYRKGAYKDERGVFHP